MDRAGELSRARRAYHHWLQCLRTAKEDLAEVPPGQLDVDAEEKVKDYRFEMLQALESLRDIQRKLGEPLGTSFLLPSLIGVLTLSLNQNLALARLCSVLSPLLSFVLTTLPFSRRGLPILRPPFSRPPPFFFFFISLIIECLYLVDDILAEERRRRDELRKAQQALLDGSADNVSAGSLASSFFSLSTSTLTTPPCRGETCWGQTGVQAIASRVQDRQDGPRGCPARSN